MAEGNVSGVDLGIDYHPVSTAAFKDRRSNAQRIDRPAAIKVYPSVDVGPAGGGQLVPWNTVAFNFGNVFYQTNSNLEIYVGEPGVYLITCELNTTVNDGNARSSQLIKNNNTIQLCRRDWPILNYSGTCMSTMELLRPGETVGVNLNFAGTVAAVKGGYGSSHLQIVKIANNT